MRNSLTKFKLKLFAEILLKMGIALVIFVILMFFIDGVLNDYLANTVSGVDRAFYLYLVQHKFELIVLLFVAVMFIAIYFSISKATTYIGLIVSSIDRVFNKEADLVKLPVDFRSVEDKLNKVKYDSLKNEQIAKEAEQRKNDLVMYLAHDIKTPLTSIIGYLSLLNESEELPVELRKKYTTISLDKSIRLEELINEFFEITRFNFQNIVLENERVSLTLMLEQLIEEFYPLFKEKEIQCNIKMETEYILYADPNKLARVFDNIIKNAVNYSDENTIFYLTVAENEQDITVCFQNKAPKIPEHKLKSIFEKFYRVDESRATKRGGSGLGLAIAKEIVELYHGKIAVESNEEYTLFTVSLPKEMLIKA